MKSLTIHIKVGNYYSILLLLKFLLCNSFARFVMIFRLFNDFSSMLPTELYMKYEDRSKAKRSIRLLYASVYSIAPNPSVSITITSISIASGYSDFMTWRLIHKPFVQELIVGQNLNELLLLSKTLLRNKLFPVRYFPTIVIMPIGPSIFFKNSVAY